MSNVVQFPKHHLTGKRCDRCFGSGGSLATHCPGEVMDSIYHLCIEDRSLDYKDGAWKFMCWDETVA